MKDHYDCVVIGGGPVGNLLASTVAAAGFDTLLLQHAGLPSAAVHLSGANPPHANLERLCASVMQVLFDGDHAWGVYIRELESESRNVGAKVVVDATGGSALLTHQLVLNQQHQPGTQAAIWGHYRQVRRDSGEFGERNLLLPTSQGNSFFWFTPLPDDITSIGVVGQSDYLLNGRGRAAQVFEDELVKCPPLADRLMNATLSGELHLVGNFLPSGSPVAGAGWVKLSEPAAQDASSHSPEACCAQCLCASAATAIIAGLRSGAVSAQQLGKWTESFNTIPHGMRNQFDPSSPPVSTAVSTK